MAGGGLPGEQLLADGTLGLATMLFHVLRQIAPVFVACATDVTARFASAGCGEERRELTLARIRCFATFGRTGAWGLAKGVGAPPPWCFQTKRRKA